MRLSALTRPEYLLRPSQIGRRLLFSVRKPGAPLVKTTLPWRHDVLVNPADGIGRAVLCAGVHELVVVETILRLLDPGESAIDVGANIGLMTSAMVAATGSGGRQGRVISFEPNQQTFRILKQNVSAWGRAVQLQNKALSSRCGAQSLNLPAGIEGNTGLATLETVGSADLRSSQVVETTRLDEVLANGLSAALLKIDVEGHELKVLEGAERLLAEHRIRDIVFEEHRPYPQEVHDLLLAHRYALFRLSRKLTRPLLLRPESVDGRQDLPSPNYLATLDPGRAMLRFRHSGWLALGHRRSGR